MILIFLHSNSRILFMNFHMYTIFVVNFAFASYIGQTMIMTDSNENNVKNATDIRNNKAKNGMAGFKTDF